MLELMKGLGFIPESRAIKLYNLGDKAVGERYDRVTYLREYFTNMRLTADRAVYVEADKLLPLLPYIRIAQTTENYLQVALHGGGEYKLPYLDVEFERPSLQETEPVLEIQGELDLTILKKTALHNLVKPEMRCIYVDGNGAVSCNFLQGTVDKGIRTATRNPLLLPPDLIDYMVSGESGAVYSLEGMLFYRNHSGTKCIWAPKGELEPSVESPWYRIIYDKVSAIEDREFTTRPDGIEEALKRLACFNSEVVFSRDKILSGDNYEPISIMNAQDGVFTIEEVLSVLPYGEEILFDSGAMFLRKGAVTVLVSEKEDE